MDTVSTFVPRDPDFCWEMFTDVALLTQWVPGLTSAEILLKERGLPIEIHFEFGNALAYTLIYSYDKERREVRWQPKLGKHEGVTGFARFELEGVGTRMTYALEQGDARSAATRALDELQPLVDAFAARVRAG